MLTIMGISPIWAYVAYCRGKGWVKVRENFPERVMIELNSEGYGVVR